MLGWGLEGVVWGLIVLNLFLVLVPVPTFLKKLQFGESYPSKSVLTFSSPLFGASLLSFLSGYADLFLVMYYLLPSDVGVYNVAVTASSSLIMILVGSIQAVLLPAFSKAFGHGGVRVVEKVFTKASRYTALVYVPSAIGLTVLSWPVVWLLAGKVYTDAVMPMMVLSVTSLGYGLSTPIMAGLQASGRTALVFRVTALALIGEVVACLVAIPFLGVVGASVGRGIFYAVTLLYGVYEANRFLTLRFDRDGLGKSFASGAVMAGVVASLELFSTSVFLLPLYIFAGFFIYLFCLKILRGVEAYDVNIIESLVPNRIRWATQIFRFLKMR